MKHSSRKVLENHERFTTVSLYMPSTYMIITPLHHPPAPTNKSSSSNHLMNNKSSSTATPNFDSSMALTILVLVTAIFFMGFFSVYLRCFARLSSTQEQQVSLRLRRSRRRNNQTSSSSGVQESSSHHHHQQQHHGLDPSTVGSLPLVLAAHVVTRNKAKEPVDCAVCLSEFQDTEMVKMIPFCEHVFHPQCIDMWFLSHSSCPLCRSTKLFPPPPLFNNSSNSSVIVNNKVDAAAHLSLISTTTELEDREVLIDDDDNSNRKSLDLESTVVVDHDEVVVMVGADNNMRLMTMRRTCSCSSLSGMRSSVHDQVLLHDESLQRSSSSRWF